MLRIGFRYQYQYAFMPSCDASPMHLNPESECQGDIYNLLRQPPHSVFWQQTGSNRTPHVLDSNAIIEYTQFINRNKRESQG
jgi:hypothetical protein